MSAFYDLASLVLVPSGYKASKVYAQKPLTTDGQLTFSRASTATRVNSAGLIEAVSSNVPRLDYLGSTCPKLLLELQRTNVVLQSSAFDNGAWIKLDTSATANAGTSPDGTANADKIVPTTTNSRHILYQGFTASTAHTFSVFAKAAGQNFLTMRLDNDTPEVNVFFNLSTGTIGSTAGGSPTMTSYGNGWYRCSVTHTPSGTETIYAVLGSANVNGSIGYAGNGTDGILLYGAQLELGAYATSYIPTTTAAVTRLVDACSKTNISSLMPSTEGTVFIDAEVNFDKSNFTILGSTHVDGGAIFTHSVYFYIVNNKIDGQLWWTPAFTGWTGLSPTLTNGRHKVAIAWKANDFAYYIDGALAASSTAYSNVPTGMNRLQIGDYYGGYATDNKYNQTLIFKTRLTNAQLAELTAL